MLDNTNGNLPVSYSGLLLPVILLIAWCELHVQVTFSINTPVNFLENLVLPGCRQVLSKLSHKTISVDNDLL